MSAVDTERDGGWLTVWFNEPERRNPLTGALLEETLGVLAGVREDRSVRGVVFRGRGKVFSAGGDLRQFREFNLAGEREPVLAKSREIARLLDAVAEAPQITVAAVHGAAVAGGLGLVCACDYVVATEDAKFGFSETRIGLTPAQIAPFVLRRLGERVGRRLMLSAATFQGREAAEFGLVDEVVASEAELDARVAAFRERASGVAPGAVAGLKALLRDVPGLPREAQVERAAENFADSLLSDEAAEGMASFFEKRKPGWAS